MSIYILYKKNSVPNSHTQIQKMWFFEYGKPFQSKKNNKISKFNLRLKSYLFFIGDNYQYYNNSPFHLSYVFIVEFSQLLTVALNFIFFIYTPTLNYTKIKLKLVNLISI